MELTIQNIEKIKGAIINQYWKVEDVQTGDIFYQFKIQNRLDGNWRELLLKRKPTIYNNFHFQRKDTSDSLPYNITEIQAFNTFLSVLEYEIDYGYKR